MWQSFLNYLSIANTSQQRSSFLRPVGVRYSEVSLYYTFYVSFHLFFAVFSKQSNERERERERQRQRETERQTDRETERDRQRETERDRESLKLYHKNTCFKYVLMKSFYSDFACLLSSENSYIYLFTFYFLLHAWYIWRPYKVVPQYC